MNILKNIRKFSILPLNKKNELLPLCINCQYFIKAETNYPDDSFLMIKMENVKILVL